MRAPPPDIDQTCSAKGRYEEEPVWCAQLDADYSDHQPEDECG
jgi:hypothetical protein